MTVAAQTHTPELHNAILAYSEHIGTITSRPHHPCRLQGLNAKSQGPGPRLPARDRHASRRALDAPRTSRPKPRRHALPTTRAAVELLRPSASVVPLTGKIADLADDLERQGMVPATPAFLALGLQGR